VEAMLQIFLEFGYPMKKIRQIAYYPSSEALEKLTDVLLKIKQVWFPHLYNSDWSSGSMNNCRSLQRLEIR
jgi:hypothetical protein